MLYLVRGVGGNQKDIGANRLEVRNHHNRIGTLEEGWADMRVDVAETKVLVQYLVDKL